MTFLVNVIVENVILGKESFLFFEQFYFLKYVNHQSGKTVKKFSCAIIYYYREKYRKPFYKKQPLCKIICTSRSKFLTHPLSCLIILNNYNSNWKKLLGFRKVARFQKMEQNYFPLFPLDIIYF